MLTANTGIGYFSNNGKPDTTLTTPEYSKAELSLDRGTLFMGFMMACMCGGAW
jgi:hypothetical protein